MLSYMSEIYGHSCALVCGELYTVKQELSGIN